MSELQGLSLIAGEAVKTGGAEFHAENPNTGERLSPAFQSATPAEVDCALQSASEAFAVYGNLPGKRRAAFLRAIAENIESLVETFVVRVAQETALPEPRIRGETARTVGQLKMFAGIAEEGSWVDARIEPAIPDRKPLPRPDVRSMLRPLGPVAVFGASNFPLAFSVAGGDTASALAAGCPVVVKAHPAHPGTSELVGRAIVEAAKSEGMPAGVFSLLFDSGHEVGTALVKHPLITAVGFTGSLAAGRALFDLACSREVPIPVYAEMGSVNPIFLLPGALAARAEKIAEGLHQSVTMGMGQLCTKPGIVLTDGHNGFRDRLSHLIQSTPSACLLHSGIATNFDRNTKHLQTHPAVRTLAAPPQVVDGCAAGAMLFETDAAAFVADKSLSEEVFGPATMLVNYRSKEELLAVARGLAGQLAIAIHGSESDLLSAQDLISVLETRAGRLVFNQFPTGVDVGQAMVHGGPYPATTDSRTTSVGGRAILRFARPVCYQNFPNAALPAELQDDNPLGIRRQVDGHIE